jgi:putative cell wall-binding protein
MRKSLMLVLAAALAALVFAPAAFAQDDNSTGDDLGGDDPDGVYDGVYIYDDNPTGDDVVATPTATTTPTSSATSTPSATPTATSTPTASATPSATVTSGVSASLRAGVSALPDSGGVPVLSVAAGVLLVGAGIVAAVLSRRTS